MFNSFVNENRRTKAKYFLAIWLESEIHNLNNPRHINSRLGRMFTLYNLKCSKWSWRNQKLALRVNRKCRKHFQSLIQTNVYKIRFMHIISIFIKWIIHDISIQNSAKLYNLECSKYIVDYKACCIADWTYEIKQSLEWPWEIIASAHCEKLGTWTI